MERSQRLYGKVNQTIRALTRLKDFCALISNLIVPTIIAVICDYQTEIVKFSPFAFYVPMAMCIVFAGFFFVISYNIKSSAEILVEMDEVTDTVKRLEKIVGVFTTVDFLCTAWRGIVDASVINSKLDEAKLLETISAMCALIVDQKDSIYHFKAGELWSFGVYKYEVDSDTLVCVCRDKCSTHPGGQMGRAWKPGQGHVGITFSNRSGKQTSDARVPEVARLLQAPVGTARAYDNETYVALQTEPVLTEEGCAPWGVIVATSNLPKRFDPANGIALNHLAGEVASLIVTNSAQPSVE